MKEKLLVYIIACLGVTLVVGLLLDGDNRVTEKLELEAEVAEYSAESVADFDEVIGGLDEFVQYCGEEGYVVETGGPDEVSIETAVPETVKETEETSVCETKEIVDAVALPETTTTVATTTVVTTKKPVVTTTRATTTKPKEMTTVATTTVATTKEKPKKTTVTTEDEGIVVYETDEFGNEVEVIYAEDFDVVEEEILLDEDEFDNSDDGAETTKFWTTEGE